MNTTASGAPISISEQNTWKLGERAAEADDVELMQEVLLRFPQWCGPDGTRDIAWNQAIKQQSPGALQLLLAQGADVNDLTQDSRPFDDAQSKPIKTEVLELLIEHGWDINNRTPGRPAVL
ncbi:hypothetical protein B0A50_05666 [Salinomyces thailandicus]|uniref:Ankyrin repeat domain-containing protein n=1 Tax=Salinomyces thailandicus TaxID=706561 RepID=A0A4U0TUB9_9PEZI|nr:hypothetical protein B0A50_05666 [Salinomyces thailandica]